MVVYCAQCGERLDADPAAFDHPPCRTCGATERRIDETLKTGAALRTKLSIKGRSPGEKRPFVEEKVGDDFHRRTGRWSKLTRLIDRRHNRYVERIVDAETGEVLWDVDEALSDHQGHGSAKRRS